MRYKGMEIHHVGEIIEREDGFTWLRVPNQVYQSLDSDMGKAMVKTAIGVELRFVIKSGSVKIKMKSLSSPSVLSTFHIFYGGIQGGWECHETDKHISTEPTEFIIQKPSNMDMLQRMTKQANLDWSQEVIRIIFERGEILIMDVEGDIEPPSKEQLPKETLLTYGSSITHGSNSLSISNAWPSVLAHHLTSDLINLGMAGSCLMEPDMIEYIASEGEKGNWTSAILELGINALSWDEVKIRERVSNTLMQIAQRNKEKQITVISPFYSVDDFNHLGEANKWRILLERIVHETNYPNVRIINGLDLLGDMSLISADEVHPNIWGMQEIAEKLFKSIGNQIVK